MKTKNKVLNTVKNILKKEPNIEFAFLFGSYAKGEETEFSDIDIAIYTKEQKDKYDNIKFEFEIETKLSEKIPLQKFDVRTLNYAPIVIVGKIINEGKLLFAQNETFLTDYIVRNRIKYMDYMIVYKPLLEQRYEELLNGR